MVHGYRDGPPPVRLEGDLQDEVGVGPDLAQGAQGVALAGKGVVLRENVRKNTFEFRNLNLWI